MMTIFSIPKPFQGHIGVIQRNAIRSWTRLSPACQVVLMGEDDGVAEIALEYGLTHVPHVDRNECGTPLLSGAFETARNHAAGDVLCYVNADIILTQDLPPAIDRVRKKTFLMTGRRWDLAVSDPLDFDRPDWEQTLRATVAAKATLHSRHGMDYFVFPRDMRVDMPPFAIGRAGWDNWFIYWARAHRAPVIDATEAVLAIHQNHDYSHHPSGKVGTRQGTEANENRRLAGKGPCTFTLGDATHFLTPQGMKPAWTAPHLWRRLGALPILWHVLDFSLTRSPKD